MKFKLICHNENPYFLFEQSVSYRIQKDRYQQFRSLIDCKPDDWVYVDYSKSYVCKINGIECYDTVFKYFVHAPITDIENQNLRLFGCFFDKYVKLPEVEMNFREYVELNEIAAKNVTIENDWYTQNRGMKTTFIHINGTQVVVDKNKTKPGYSDFKVEFWLTQQAKVMPPVYSFKFYFDHPTSGYTTKQTSANQVEATTLIPAVQIVFEKFIDMVDDDCIIHFISDITEPSRIRLYDRLFSKLPKLYYKFDNEDVVADKEDDSKHYAFTKSKQVFDGVKDGSYVIKQRV